MTNTSLMTRPAPPEPTFPLVYAMALDCPGGFAGYNHADQMLFNTLEEPKLGDIVAIHFKDGRQAALIELTMGLMPGSWLRMPYTEHPESTALAVIVGTILGTDRTVCVQLQTLWAAHVCDGLHERAAS